MKRLALFALVALAPLSVPPAPARAAEEGPPAAAVSKAIDAGAQWLKSQFKDGLSDTTFHDAGELVILTLSHCGVNLTDRVYADGIKALESVEPRFTYRTALLAMALSEVNPRLYRKKIAHCAQWLVDTQLKEGEWGYPGLAARPGHPTEGVKVQPPAEPDPAAPPASGAKPGAKPAAKPSDRVVIARQTPVYAGPGEKGDFSNTQFAILGLRACRDAGIDVPAETWKDALAYLRKYQRPDGGFGYVTSGEQDEVSYASLTCAGACSAAICLAATGVKDPKGDPLVKKALAWIAKNDDVGSNVGIDTSSIVGPSDWQCYHLYSLERAARVLGVADIGGKPWYGPGATWLLSKQAGDGHWEDTRKMETPPAYFNVADTCFALLFLTRATRPLTGK